MLPVPICFYPHCPLLLFHPSLPLLEVPCPSPWLNYQRSLTNRLVSTRRASIDRSGRVHYHLTGHSFAVVQLHPRKPCHAICIELHQNLSPTSNDFQNPCDPFSPSALFCTLHPPRIFHRQDDMQRLAPKWLKSMLRELRTDLDVVLASGIPDSMIDFAGLDDIPSSSIQLSE